MKPARNPPCSTNMACPPVNSNPMLFVVDGMGSPTNTRTLLPVMTWTVFAPSVTFWNPNTPEISTPGKLRLRLASIAKSGPAPTLIEPKAPLTVTDCVPVLMSNLTVAPWLNPGMLTAAVNESAAAT